MDRTGIRGPLRALLLLLAICAGLAAAAGPASAQPAPASESRVAAPPNAAQTAVDSSGAHHLQPLSPVGERVIATVGGPVRATLHFIQSDFAAVRANWRRLGGLSNMRWRTLGDTGRAVLPMVAVSLFTVLAGRLLLVQAYRGMGRAAARRGPLAAAALGLVKFLADLALVFVAVLAAVAVHGGAVSETDPPVLSYYLAAFFLTGALVAVVLTIFSPSTAALRILPVGDATARYWSRRLSVVVVLLAFAEAFVPAALRNAVTPITAHSVKLALQVAGLIYLIWLVTANRAGPIRHFDALAAAREDDAQAAILAFVMRYWHVPALVFLAFLIHQLMTEGAAAVPALIATAEIAGAIAVAMLAFRLLDGLATRGVRLSERTQRLAPGMQRRLDAFVPPLVRVLRTLLIALWLLFVFQVVGALELLGWVETRMGVDLLGTTFRLIVTVLVAFAVWLALDGWIDFRLADRGSRRSTAREQTLLTLLRNAAAVGIIVLTAYYALLDIGISLAPLLASAGVIALAISWGSQKLVQDVITGLFIQLENAINVGDVVEAAGKTGVVEKLTIRSVSLRDVHGVFHVIPFSSVDSVSNYMKGFSYHVADVPIAYDADIDAAKLAMIAAYDDLADMSEWSGKLVGGFEWFGVESLGDSGVMLRARLKTLPGQQWAVGRAYNELVKKRFDAEGIEIPFPQMKLWLAAGGPEALVGGPGRRSGTPGAAAGEAAAAGDEAGAR